MYDYLFETLLFLLAVRRFRHRNDPTPAFDNLASLLLSAAYDATLNSAREGGWVRNLLLDAVGLVMLRELLRRLSKFVRFVRFEALSTEYLKNTVGSALVKQLERLPLVKDKVQEQFAKIEHELEEEIKSKMKNEVKYLTLPPRGLSKSEIVAKLAEYASRESPRWKKGMVSGAVYHGGEEMLELQTEAIRLYNITNPLHADLFPSVSKFEAECIKMTCELLNGGRKEVCGTMTSGGTESIIMATKTHREWAKERKGICRPEIIAPETAHAAIDKACEILKIKLIHAPVNKVTRRADVAEIEKRITSDTIMIYSSAPSFPHGVVDPIEELSRLAVKYGVGLHVDCCLGGFILPFIQKCPEYATDPVSRIKFNFELPGVSSMSVDTHKYGYATKGTSIVLYKSPDLRRFQYFSYPRWPGGLYTTPSTAGSRPGSLSAAAWAGMLFMGREGYESSAKQIVGTARKIKAGIERECGDALFVYGDPLLMVVGFGAKHPGLNIYNVGKAMEKRGWSLNSLQNPPSLHVCVTLPLSKNAETLVADLRSCVLAEMEKLRPGSTEKQATPIYGIAAEMPSGPVIQVLQTFNDVVLKAD